MQTQGMPPKDRDFPFFIIYDVVTMFPISTFPLGCSFELAYITLIGWCSLYLWRKILDGAVALIFPQQKIVK